jgi:hypothetical protein
MPQYWIIKSRHVLWGFAFLETNVISSHASHYYKNVQIKTSHEMYKAFVENCIQYKAE